MSKETYTRAFQRLTGTASRLPVRTGGRTDQMIMRDLFERHGLAVPDGQATEAALAAAGEDDSGAPCRDCPPARV